MPAIDVLSLEWTTYPSRDRLMATLVCNYLRMMNLEVVEGSMFDSLSLMQRLKPKLVFIANSVGAPENLAAVQYAKTLGCKVLTLISEGNFQGDDQYLTEMIWGWNKEKKLYEDFHMQWSTRTRDLTLRLFPALDGKIKVSGGVGFDNYKFIKPVSRETFLDKWGKSRFSKIAGVGLWDFGCVCFPEDRRYPIFSKLYSPDQIKRFASDRIEFNLALSDVIQSNSDVLFLLKEHPGVLHGDRASAIEGLRGHQNVLVLKNEESIVDCIAVSDFWFVYESTTAMEAWLLEKNTCLLNPSGRNFPRDIINRGSPHVENAIQLNEAVKCFYDSGYLPGFPDRIEERNQIIKQTIQWSDGLNHVRAGNQILDVLESVEGVLNLPELPSLTISRWKQKAKWLFFRALGRLGYMRNPAIVKWDLAELDRFSAEKAIDQEMYYSAQGLTRQQLRQIQAI